MAKYLYSFGFETPEQRKANRLHGWDDEDSRAVFIEAANSEEALQWGREVSERFYKRLHNDPRISWREGQFASWIEEDYEKRFGPGELKNIGTVRVGEMPDLEKLAKPGSVG